METLIPSGGRRPSRRHLVARCLALLLLIAPLIAPRPTVAQTGRPGSPAPTTINAAPNPPVISEPAIDGHIVNAADVHMETFPFSDPDVGDTHLCTDWEIWTVTAPQRVWSALCVTGIDRVHIHLGDGTFENSHAGRNEMLPSTDYRLQVRHRDNTMAWSAFSQRFFTTGAATTIFPLALQDVLNAPAPTWLDNLGDAVVLPPGTPPPSVSVESPASAALLEFRGLDGNANQVTNPAALAAHVNARVHIKAGSGQLTLPQSQIAFTDGGGADRTIYLPSASLAPTTDLYLWIAANGSTYYGSAGQTEPDFSTLAQGSTVPWEILKPGYQVEVVATGFQLPVNIAFVPNPGPNPTDPFYYVTELYGTIKVVNRDGTIGNYATGLLNFNPTGDFPGSGEQGLTGIAVDPTNGDIFVSLLYDSAPPNGAHYPKVLRMHSTDGGHTAATTTTVLDMVGESQGQSHQISNLSFGPDDKLYVHMGDGFEYQTAQNLDSYRGKVLRLNRNGTAPSDNPFYNAGNGINARDYVFAYGVRNPFGGTWRGADNKHYHVENGPNRDRMGQIIAGRNFGWNNTDASMSTFAIYNWEPSNAPVNLAFIQNSSFNGSGFPVAMRDHLFVTESGPTWATGPQSRGKFITEFVLAANGDRISGPDPFIRYNGNGKATASGLAAGPDGLYFSDLYKDLNYASPIDAGANILRIKYVGAADFSADQTSGPAPLAVQFSDISTVISPTAWFWDFGDGTTSSLRNPSHTYLAAGSYDVRLRVTGASGVSSTKKEGYINAGVGIGLQGEYFNNMNLTAFVSRRIDAAVDFNWGQGAPAAGVGVDTFSVRWTGQVQPQHNEQYAFYTNTDDGVRLWVDGVQVINQWVDQQPTEHSGTTGYAFQAGRKYTIRMEFFDNGGDAIAQLSWSSPSRAKQIIPSERLYPPADLGLAMSAPTTVVAGTQLTYTLAITNTGIGPAYNIVVTDTLPLGSPAAQIVPSQGSCEGLQVVITCTLGSLASGGTAAITLSLTVDGGRTTGLTNQATVNGESFDPQLADNSDSVSTAVTSRADLGLTVAAPGSVLVNRPLTYTITLTNHGPSHASAITLTTDLPAGVTLVSGSGIGWTCAPAGQRLTCTRSALEVYNAPQIVVATSPTQANTVVQTTVAVTARTADGTLANNSVIVSTSILNGKTYIPLLRR